MGRNKVRENIIILNSGQLIVGNGSTISKMEMAIRLKLTNHGLRVSLKTEFVMAKVHIMINN